MNELDNGMKEDFVRFTNVPHYIYANTILLLRQIFLSRLIDFVQLCITSIFETLKKYHFYI